MTTSVIILPNGDAISNSVIKSVSLHNRGVICKDSQQRIAVFVPVSDEEKGKRVRDIFIKFIREGRIAQPSWDFLHEDAEGPRGPAATQ